MKPRRGRRVFGRLGINLAAIALGLIAAGTVAAHSGSPKTIVVTQTTPLTVSATGTWTWPGNTSLSEFSYIGYALSWGDITSGNDVGSYHVGDGTAATNVVLQPTSPARGTSGSFGPVTHTYAAAGTYTVCVIIYDLGETKPFATTGWDSLQAGGTGGNMDNSVDGAHRVPVECATIDVTGPSPSASSSVLGVTSPPNSPVPSSSVLGVTSPPTTTADVPPAPNQGLPTLPLIMLVGSSIGSTLVFKTVKVRR